MPPPAILRVPDPRLRLRARPVGAFDADLARLARAMLGAMYAAHGRGLAAPQIGAGLRLFVMDARWKDGPPDPRVFADPEILWTSPETATRSEGCLSIPGPPVSVTRPARLRLAWRTLAGEPRTAPFDGWEAACIQHEIDHLDGILVTDRADQGGQGA
ncbi:peptide deformylase [Rubellimicrobium sp. CFH 75288]|uniref:peptide deformylase n=1 Tax=Rubellimicrobium sp. CFH 75288 TaxID=2697034 RepID=UPI00352B3F2B